MSGELKVDLITLVQEIQLHLNNAGASLAAEGNPKFARSGLGSAAAALALSALALRFARFENDEERRSIEDLNRQASRLGANYWVKFNMIQNTNGHEPPIEPTFRLKDNFNARHVVAKPPAKEEGHRGMLTPDSKKRIVDLIIAGPPDGVSKTSWYRTVGGDEGLSVATVYRIEKELRTDGKLPDEESQ